MVRVHALVGELWWVSKGLSYVGSAVWNRNLAKRCMDSNGPLTGMLHFCSWIGISHLDMKVVITLSGFRVLHLHTCCAFSSFDALLKLGKKFSLILILFCACLSPLHPLSRAVLSRSFKVILISLAYLENYSSQLFPLLISARSLVDPTDSKAFINSLEAG